MITREADYGMRMVLALSKGWKGNGACKPVGEIAREMEIPYRFLRKIAGRMSARGLIESQKGKGGGVRLTRSPATISVLDVIVVMAPASAELSQCVNNPGQCRRSGGCSIHKALAAIQQDVMHRLRLATFDRLAATPCQRAGSDSADGRHGR